MNAIDQVISEVVKARPKAKPIDLPPSRKRAAMPLTGTILLAPPATLSRSGAEPVGGGQQIHATHLSRAPVATIPAKRGASKPANLSSKPSGLTPTSTTLPAREAREATNPTSPNLDAPLRRSIRRKADSAAGQTPSAHQQPEAGGANPSDEAIRDVNPTQRTPLVGERGGDHASAETQRIHVSAPLISSMIFNWRLRQRWHSAEKSLVLQAKALLRSIHDGDKDKANAVFDDARAPFARKRRPEGFDPFTEMVAKVGDHVAFALAPFVISIDQIARRREAIEKQIANDARQIPVWPWVETISGFGALTLASVIGESGDVGSYKSVSALWKRFGLAVLHGERQRKVADAALALEHGYSPPRRAVAYLLGQWLIMAGDRNPYRSVYEVRKAYELPRCEAIAADPNLIKRYSRSGKYAPKAHANNRAARYMVKRVLRELYAAWRAIERGEQPLLPARSDTQPTATAPADPIECGVEPLRPGHLVYGTQRADAGALSFPIAAE